MNIGLAGLSNRQLNQVITITLRLTLHANIFLNTYPVIVFSYLSLQPLFPCTRTQQCFTTATIRSFGHFEHLELPLSSYYYDNRARLSRNPQNSEKFDSETLQLWPVNLSEKRRDIVGVHQREADSLQRL